MNTQQQQRVWNMAFTVGALLVVFLAVLSVKEIKSIGYVGKSGQTANTITVSGTGDAAVVPDIATFSFTVTETANTVADAQTQATAKVNLALKAVRDAGVADKDIQTQSYSIDPHYDYSGGICTVNGCPPSRQVLSGYDVSETIQVKVRDLSKAGDLFSSIGSIGVQNVDSLSFTVDDIDAVKDVARAAAIANARSKAGELSKELGVSLVGITSFYDSSDNPQPIYGMSSDAVGLKSAAPAVAPQVPAGEQKITSTVSITYEIK